MSEITKSLSEVLRQIKASLTINAELFDFPKTDIGCAISIAQIKDSKNSGTYFSVNVNLSCECRVSLALDNNDLKAVELAALAFAEIEGNTFNCSAKPPTDLSAVPGGNDERFCHWIVNWDQEFYVERIDLT